MPELPEVTTMVRDLARTARGKVIHDVWVDTPKIVKPLSVEEFRRRVTGKQFLKFDRKGKNIIAYLGPRDSGSGPLLRRVSRGTKHDARMLVLVWHMRMTGHPLFRNPEFETRNPKLTEPFADPRNQHIRLSFRFADGSRLDYSDVRKFGTLHLVPHDALSEHDSLKTLGPDALAHRWTPAEICARLQRRRTELKQALLDQRLIAGIGNIYADEILWAARVHPLTRTETLAPPVCRRLVASMRSVLTRAVGARGTSMDDYRDIRGRKGRYGDIRRVYQRTGERCFRCGATIARLVVGGRGTHVCPQCQPRR